MAMDDKHLGGLLAFIIAAPIMVICCGGGGVILATILGGIGGVGSYGEGDSPADGRISGPHL